MGCCFSRAATKNQNPQNTQPHLTSSLPKSNHEEAPLQPPEEEFVKEVLSETPILKAPQVSILMPETKTQTPLVQNPSEKFENKVPTDELTEVVISQLSETCTVTESFSTATTATVTEKREDEATSKPCSREPTTSHKWNRSPSRKRPLVTDANVTGGNERRVKSPARRPEPSPEKKIKTGSRLVRGREAGSVTNRKVNAGLTGVRRDSGEGSGRRSRSPSCSRTVGGSGKVGIGVGRKQAPTAVENAREKKSESEEVGEKNGIVTSEEVGEKSDIVFSEEVGEKNDIVLQGESIENPHVSMECFIFL